MRNLYSQFPFSCYVTIAFMAGIYWQEQGHSLWIAIPAFSAILLLNLLTKSSLKTIFLWFLISTAFMLGCIRYYQQYHSSNLFYETYGHSSYDIIGSVLAIESTSQNNFNRCFSLHINKIKKHNHNDKWNPLDKKIFVYTKSTGNLDVTDTIKLENIRFKKPNNQSFNSYLIKENSAATIFLSPLKYNLLEHPTYSFRRGIEQCKRVLMTRLKQKLSSGAFQFFITLFLGNSAEKRKMFETKHAFKAWGIMHYLARSGLHLIFFIFLWYLLLRFLPISYNLKHLILVIITIVYSIFSWTSISFVRALLTFLIYKIGSLFTFQTNLLNLLSIICFITLLINPIQLFFLDFQLSFGLTAALACFHLTNN